MKVLQFIPSLNAYDGGTTTYMQELTPALGKLVELHVCALGRLEDCVKLENATVHTIELKLKNVCQMHRQWMSLLEEINPDIVHINCCWLPQCALVQYWTRQWQKENSPIAPCLFLTPHGMLEPWIIRRNYWTKKVPAIWLYQRWAVKNADVIVATAEEERRHIAELGWNSRIEMVPNGINTDRVEMRTVWKDAKDLLFMSRLHPKKGLEMLIEALSRVDGLTLKIAGDGDPEYVESLKTLVSKQRLDDRIMFVGPVYGDQKWKLIRVADVVVLPSYSENFGLIVAEALASGTPVLTTTGTPWSSIQERNCGWWVQPDVGKIADALDEVKHKNMSEMKEMGQRARIMVEEMFDVTSLAKALSSLYAINSKC